MPNKDIIQELNDLGSSLTGDSAKNLYSVPEGYFEGFATEVQRLIWLASLFKKNPYHVPLGYFDGLEEQIMQSIRKHPDYQTSNEELESISPLLSSLNKRPVYSVPHGYFENFKVGTNEKVAGGRVTSITSRKWFKYAAAAVIISVIAIGAVLVFNGGNNLDAKNNPQAWVAKNMKKVSSEEINEFVTLTNEDSILKASVASNSRTDDVKELMKDVSIAEIDKFLRDASIEDGTDNSALPN